MNLPTAPRFARPRPAAALLLACLLPASMAVAGATASADTRRSSPPRTDRTFRMAPVETVPQGSAVIPAAVLESLRTAGPSVEVKGVPLDHTRVVDLLLTEVSPTGPDLRIEVARRRPDGTIDTRTMERPDLRCFRGTARGLDGSEVFLSVHGDFIGGFVRLPEGVRFLSSAPRGSGRPALSFDPARLPASLLPSGDPFCNADELAHPEPPPARGGGTRDDGGVAGGVCQVVSIAIETDLEFTAALFGGNTANAAAYAIALTAASSEVFELDTGVRLRVDYLRLWEESDPWDQGGPTDQLFQFRDHWQSLMQEVPRDLAHFYSGRGLGGGVAWLPGLCGSFNYALSANLGGFFPYPIVDYSNQNWDLMVVTHEFGHNFGAPHTHQVSPPIDNCGNNDCSAGAVGTIMSYCHLCPGGLANVAMRFHPGTIASIQSLMASIACDYSGGPDPIAGDDFVSSLAGESVEIDVLANDLGGECSVPILLASDAFTAAGHPITEVEGPNGRPLLRVDPSSLDAGADSFAYTLTDEFGGVGSGSVSIEWLAVRPAVPVSGTVPGAVASYFEIPQSSVLPNFAELSPYATEVVPRIDFPSTGGTFAGSGRSDLVAATYEGWIEVPDSGMWTLYTDSDDGSRLWIGETLVVDNDGLHGMVERSGQIALAAGRHPVRVEFFENFGGAGLIVRVSGDATPKQVVPAAWWSHGGSTLVGDIDGDGTVGGDNLGLLLANWGPCVGCAADLDGDGEVGGSDLGLLLANWGI
jgi:hypothetical protein